MVRLESILNEVENADRRARKTMQIEAIRTLRARDVEDGDLARYLKIDIRPLHKWERGTVVARPSMIAHLVYLSRLPRLPDMQQTRTKVRRGRIPNQDIKELRDKMKAHGLWPPPVRARTLQELKEATGLGIVEFAARLGVGKTQSYKYLDPKYKPVMSEEVVENAIKLRQEVDTGAAPITPEAEFKGYLTVLLGPKYAKTGLPENTTIKALAFRELRKRTAMSDRALEYNLPPKRTEGAPRRAIMRVFKEAAKLGPLLPQLAAGDRRSSRKKAAAASS